MSLIADLFVRLGFKSDEFNKGIDGAQKKASSFGSAMGKIGGMIAGAFAVGGILNFGKSSMEEFNKAEQGAMRLLTALGGNSRALDMLSNQAKTLQKTTLFEDDETIAAQAAMAMLVKEADKIRELTPLVQDLATAKGIDLTSAGFMVAKSVEGSAMALQKMGIQVEGTAGSAERFASVMEQLNKKVGGQAANAANVGTGAATQMGIAYDNLKESIGGVIVNFGGIYKYTAGSFKQYFEDQAAMIETKAIPAWRKFLNVITGNVKGFAEQEKIAKETSDKWNKELAPKDAKSTVDKKSYTQAEQLAARLKQLQKDISDTTVEMTALDGATPEWKAKADELKGFQEEMDGLTGATKAQEEADKRATQAKADLVDQLILMRIEEQKILELQGKLISVTDKKTGQTLTQISPKGAGKVGSNEDLKPSKDAGELKNSTWATKILSGMSKEATAMEKNKALVKGFNDEVNNLIASGMEDAAMTFGKGLGALMSGDMNIGEFGAGLINSVGAFLVNFGQLMIQFALAKAALELALKIPGGWPIALAAGIALVAIGSAMSNASSKGLSGSASSGGGSSAASGYAGMQGQSTAVQTIQVKGEFELQGNKLVALINNVDRRNLNFK